MSHAIGSSIQLDGAVSSVTPVSAGRPDGRHVIAYADQGTQIAIHGFDAEGNGAISTIEAGGAMLRLWLIPQPGGADAGYVLLWNAATGGALHRLFLDADGNPIGQQPDIVAAEDWNHFSDVAMAPLSDGRWVMAWMGWQGYTLQVLAADGEAVGDPVILADYIYEPTIVPDAEGGFTLLAQAYEGFETTIVSVRFDAQLHNLERKTLVTAPVPQAMAPVSGGECVIGWIAEGSLEIVVVDALAEEIVRTSSFALPSASLDDTLRLTPLADGDVLAVWTRLGADGAMRAIDGLRINADGSPDGGVFEIDSRPGVQYGRAAVGTALPNGDVFVTFQTIDGTGNVSIHRRMVDYASDAPQGSDRTVGLQEDGQYAFSPGDFEIADANNDRLAGIEITALPEHGRLAFASGDAAVGMVLSAEDIAQLVYRPDADGHGASYATFGFRVIDNGASGTGGSRNVAADPNTITFDVAATADAPSGKDRNVTIIEDGRHVFSIAEFGFSDADGDTFAMLELTTLPSGTITLDGSALLAGQRIAAGDIARLVYAPAQNASGQTGFTFKVIDDSDADNRDTSPRTYRFDILAVNDAPSGADRTIHLVEDGSYAFKAADFGFADTADGHRFQSVVITTVAATGTLVLAGKAVKAGQVIGSADLGKLVYTPGVNATGTASFSFQVMDDGGTANGGRAIDPTPNTLRIQIAAVNDAPSGTDRTVNLLEDAGYTFKSTDFGFSDKTDGHAFKSATLTTLPASGTLTLSGKAVKAGQVIAAADLARLVYVPAANASGAASFTFQVADTGGTASGGRDIDPMPDTFRFQITAVNDAPSGADRTIGLLEDARHTFKATDFGFSDKADGHALQSARLATLPAEGTLTLAGKAVKAGQVIAAADLAKLVYAPAAHATRTASFTFAVTDAGGTANGGRDIDPTPNTLRFQIASVNDAPSGASRTVALPEDRRHIFKASDFGFSDKADGHALSGIKIAATPADGKLALAGKAVKAGQVIAVADFGKLVFTPPANEFGKNLATLKFQVIDNGGKTQGGIDTDPTPNTLTFNVSDVTDAFKGTSRPDKLTGTMGHDVIDGRAGADTLRGRGGPDTFVFKTGYDRDQITDFDARGTDHDTLDISGLKSVTGFSDLKKSHMRAHGADVWIDGGSGDLLVLKAVKIGDLTKDDFLF